jgi:hypothetical protein
MAMYRRDGDVRLGLAFALTAGSHAVGVRGCRVSSTIIETLKSRRVTNAYDKMQKH